MGQSSEELRYEIEATRSDMSGTLEAIGDRVSPSRKVERTKNRARNRFSDLRESVMGRAEMAGERVSSAGHTITGSAGSAASSVGGTASHLAGSVREAPGSLASRAEGAPLAAGAVAFGLGMVLAAVLPKSEREQQDAQRLAGAAEPLKQGITEVGREVGQHLQEAGKEHAQQLGSTAQEAVGEVKGQAQAVAQEVKGAGQEATQVTREQASSAAQQVKPS